MGPKYTFKNIFLILCFVAALHITTSKSENEDWFKNVIEHFSEIGKNVSNNGDSGKGLEAKSLQENCVNGVCPKATDGNTDKTGFMDGVWSVYLFSIIGIIAFAGGMFLLLRFVCASRSIIKNDTIEPATTSKTDKQKSYLSFQNQGFNNSQNEISPNQFSASPAPFDNTVFPNNQYPGEPNFANYHDDQFKQHPGALSSFTPIPGPSQNHLQPQENFNQTNLERSVSLYDNPKNAAFVNTGNASPSIYPRLNHNDNGPREPFQYLDKYHSNSNNTPSVEPMFPSKIVLRSHTPYKVVQHNIGAEFAENADTNDSEYGYGSEFSVPDDSNRFVRVLPRLPANVGGLSPVLPPKDY